MKHYVNILFEIQMLLIMTWYRQQEMAELLYIVDTLKHIFQK